MKTLVFSPALDTRHGEGIIRSRIGIEATAKPFHPQSDLYQITETCLLQSALHCILIDEAQFLTKAQVYQCGEISDKCKIPVLTYGLRTDFLGELFEGSQYLLAWADVLKEIKAVCHCGRKATMVLRLNENGHAIRTGQQIEIGGNERYTSLCRFHYRAAIST